MLYDQVYIVTFLFIFTVYQFYISNALDRASFLDLIPISDAVRSPNLWRSKAQIQPVLYQLHLMHFSMASPGPLGCCNSKLRLRHTLMVQRLRYPGLPLIQPTQIPLPKHGYDSTDHE